MARINYFLTDFRWVLALLFLGLILFCTSLLLLGRSKLAIKNYLLACISGLFFLLTFFTLAEIYYRYIYDSSDGIGFLKVNQKWHQRHVVFNSNFRRDREFSTRTDPDEFRIAVVGDSIAFGIGIENAADRFPDLLEQKLKAQTPNVTVYNLGMSGVSTADEITAFRQMEYLKFDMVIWEYFLNDINTATTSANAKITDNIRNKINQLPLLKYIHNHSYFLDFLYWRFAGTYDQTFKQLVAEDLRLYDDPTMFPGHAAQITEFIWELNSKHIPVIAVIFPLIHSEAIREQAQVYVDRMVGVFTATPAIAVIDLSPSLNRYPVNQLKASQFDQHPNELVHRIVADLLYEKIH